MKLSFPEPFKHDHPPIQNINDIFREQLTAGQRTADGLAKLMGSWKFIIVQSIILALWAVLNIIAWIQHWDPYPFILMNLVLSLQAAYAAPIIMMSQNRQSERDRLEAHNDFNVNKKSEEEIRALLNHSVSQDAALREIHKILLNIEKSGIKEND